MDGDFLFIDPVSWQTHRLTSGATLVLREAALAIEQNRYEAFVAEVEAAGGWPTELEFLAETLTTLCALDESPLSR